MGASKQNVLKSVVLFAVFFCIAFFGTRYLMGSKTQRKLKEVSEEINQNCPTKIDSETRLDSTSVTGETFNYHYSLPNESVSARSFDVHGAKNFIRTQAQKNYETSPQMKDMREMGIELHYYYRDGHGAPAFDFSIKPKQK